MKSSRKTKGPKRSKRTQSTGCRHHSRICRHHLRRDMLEFGRGGCCPGFRWQGGNKVTTDHKHLKDNKGFGLDVEGNNTMDLQEDLKAFNQDFKATSTSATEHVAGPWTGTLPDTRRAGRGNAVVEPMARWTWVQMQQMMKRLPPAPEKPKKDEEQPQDKRAKTVQKDPKHGMPPPQPDLPAPPPQGYAGVWRGGCCPGFRWQGGQQGHHGPQAPQGQQGFWPGCGGQQYHGPPRGPQGFQPGLQGQQAPAQQSMSLDLGPVRYRTQEELEEATQWLNRWRGGPEVDLRTPGDIVRHAIAMERAQTWTSTWWQSDTATGKNDGSTPKRGSNSTDNKKNNQVEVEAKENLSYRESSDSPALDQYVGELRHRHQGCLHRREPCRAPQKLRSWRHPRS